MSSDAETDAQIREGMRATTEQNNRLSRAARRLALANEELHAAEVELRLASEAIESTPPIAMVRAAKGAKPRGSVRRIRV